MWYLRLKFVGGEWMLLGQTDDIDVKKDWQDEQQALVRRTKVDDTHIIERQFGARHVTYDDEGDIVDSVILD